MQIHNYKISREHKPTEVILFIILNFNRTIKASYKVMKGGLKFFSPCFLFKLKRISKGINILMKVATKNITNIVKVNAEYEQY